MYFVIWPFVIWPFVILSFGLLSIYYLAFLSFGLLSFCNFIIWPFCHLVFYHFGFLSYGPMSFLNFCYLAFCHFIFFAIWPFCHLGFLLFGRLSLYIFVWRPSHLSRKSEIGLLWHSWLWLTSIDSGDNTTKATLLLHINKLERFFLVKYYKALPDVRVGQEPTTADIRFEWNQTFGFKY